MARGDGPCVPKTFGGRSDDEPGENRLSEDVPKPKLVLGVAIDGGLEAEGVGRGGAPELNSAHFGHLRFVSRDEIWSVQSELSKYAERQLTHMSHLTTMTTSSLHQNQGSERVSADDNK